MRLARLLGAILVVSLQRELAFRTDFFVRVALTLLTAAGTVGTLAAVYTHLDRLGGWTYGEAIVVLGMFVTVNGVLQALIEPNLEWFHDKIRIGALDDLLLRPAPDAFLASFATCRPFALVDTVIGAGLIGYGLSVAGRAVTLDATAAAVALAAAGVIVAWAIRFTLAAMAFRAGGLELTVLFSAPWQLGRYPADLYGGGLRFVVTYVVPVAFVSTVPARALTAGPSAGALLAATTAAVVSTTIALTAWRLGIRSYTSATS